MLTANEPKPLLIVGGVPLIERQLARLATDGFADVVINLSYRGAQIRSWLGDGRRFGVAITYSEEGEPPLETAGGIVHALPWLGSGPFLLVNSDVYTDLDLASFAAQAAGRSTLLLVPNPAHNVLGDFGLDEDGSVTMQEPRLTYGGVAVLDTKLFDGLHAGAPTAEARARCGDRARRASWSVLRRRLDRRRHAGALRGGAACRRVGRPRALIRSAGACGDVARLLRGGDAPEKRGPSGRRAPSARRAEPDGRRRRLRALPRVAAARRPGRRRDGPTHPTPRPPS